MKSVSISILRVNRGTILLIPGILGTILSQLELMKSNLSEEIKAVATVSMMHG